MLIYITQIIINSKHQELTYQISVINFVGFVSFYSMILILNSTGWMS